MTQEELKKLRSYYHSILQVQDVVREQPSHVIHEGIGEIVLSELTRLEAEFPQLVPNRTPNTFTRWSSGGYVKAPILAYLGMVIGRLKVAIEADQSSQVLKPLDFPFIKDGMIRQIVERDFVEIQKLAAIAASKSLIILVGGTIEAIILDLLQKHEAKAKAAIKAPKDKGVVKDLKDWVLYNLIQVAVELGLVSPSVEKLSHSVREYRNVIHPAVEIRSGLKVEPEEARIALEILSIIHRDLS